MSGDDDKFWGKLFGMGPAGVENTVYKACLEIGTLVRELSPDAEPKEIILDVFGFSRGAAAARYFVNCFNKGSVTYSEYSMWDILFNSPTVHEAEVPEGRNIKIRFVGIFDTVAAIGLATNSYNYDVNVHLEDGVSAEKIVHLVADENDEFRTNFRLNCNTPDGGIQKVFPGAHTDVGGGYHTGPEERLLYKYSGISRSRTGAETLLTRQKTQMELDLAANKDLPPVVTKMLDEGWATQSQISVKESSIERFIIPTMPPVIDYSFEIAYIMTRELSNRLSRIPLHYMHQQAREIDGFPFSDMLSGPDYDLPMDDPDIVLAKEALMAGEPVDLVVHKRLRNKYVHCSSKFDAFMDDPNAWMGFRPQGGLRRKEYANDKTKAER
nr:DUF2235 domain-containing protein [Halocynthiibacter namhaensis]